MAIVTSYARSSPSPSLGVHEACSTAVLCLVVRRDRGAAGRQQRIVEIGPRPPPLRGPMCSRLRGQSPMRAVTQSRAPGALSGGEPPGAPKSGRERPSQDSGGGRRVLPVAFLVRELASAGAGGARRTPPPTPPIRRATERQRAGTSS